jgi:uncharacterized protein YfaS (alpha-2-macroglobulin family)
MPATAFIRLGATALIISLMGSITSCKQKLDPPSNPQNYTEYVSAYSSGLISKEATIRVVLAKASQQYAGANQPADADLLSFKPALKGSLIWEDPSTLLFTPDENLPKAQAFQGVLQLAEIYADVPEDLKTFTFNFQIIDQIFEVNSLNLRTYSNSDLSLNKIEGVIISNDVAEMSTAEKLLSANQGERALSVRWDMHPDRKRFTFTIDSIQRGDEASEVVFRWAEDVGDLYREPSLTIPALGDFSIVGVRVIQRPEQQVVINFSDPLDENQNLNGLVDIEQARLSSFLVDDTELHVFVNGTLNGKRKLTVFPGVKNTAGFAYKNTYEGVVQFADLKPAVELIGSGNIIPSSANLALPFKAVNLKAVDVFVLKIYADNVAQFLQTNQLEGDYQLKRVGRPIAYKKIDLVGSAADLKSWNNFSIDLAEMVEPEPGAIYRIELKFKPAYSLFQCEGEQATNDVSNLEPDELNTSAYDAPDTYYWDDYYYYDYYWEEYSYRERDNPCNPAYYTDRRAARRNILATNIALTVKGGDKNEFTAFVTDIKTSTPVSGAQVKLLNYQQQTMKTGTTANDGSVTLQLEGKPFLAIAQYNGQSAYLRIDDGSSLSLSNFDVAGSDVKQGLKGFIYAERGVWRPGDSIFTTFMLEDREKTLPDGHPVIFEVRNPEGKLVERQVKRTHENGIYTFPFATDADAITGFYGCQVRVGSNSFTRSLRVETIKPNRLKVRLEFDADVLLGDQASAKLHANWLTGAKARNLKADINLQMRSNSKPFEKFARYDFTDDTRRFFTSEDEVFAGKIDQDGNADLNLKLGTYKQAPGMLKAVFVTRVFEEGGDFSIDRLAVPYSPFDHFVGMKVERKSGQPWMMTDSPITVDLVTTTHEGETANRKVSAQVYAIDWSWWWSSGRSGMANYLNSSYARAIKTTTVTTSNGRGSFDFQVNYPNYGNYLIRVCDEKSGHCASQVVYVDWPMSRNRNGRSNPGAPTMLTFTTDKENYNVGDVAHLTVPTSESGRLLVSVESGARIRKHFWVDAQAGQTEFDLDIEPEMAPNVYAFVSYIQPHSQTTNDLPIRLYGVIPINVRDESTRLKPTLQTAAEWRPEDKAEITVGEENGRAMTYTLAVVDEGLLDITRFKTPDPWKKFYAKEALGIRTWDYFDDVMGAFGGVIEKNFAIGGDDEIDPAGKKRLNRFKPLVKFFGPFSLPKGKKTTHSFNMPNYIGSARVMVVARHDEAYGHAEKAVPVRKPLMVLATLPRVLGPGESVRLPVQVFAMKENIKNVEVQIKTGSLFKVPEKTQKLRFDEIGDQMAYFDLEVANQAGEGSIDITVKSGSERASYNVAVQVRNPNSVETRKQTIVLEPGQTHEFAFEAFGMKGTNSLALNASLIPELNIADALSYLLRYPHGCNEQTISTAFPQLYVGRITSLSNEQELEVKTNILYALNKLQSNQLPGGAFSSWPSGNKISSWTSIYAGHFMLEAEMNGYTIPGNMKKRWLNYEKKAATTWRYNSSVYWNVLEQSYRLFALALAGEPDMGAMNRLRNTTLTKSAGWRLAAAYALVGQSDIANELMNRSYTSSASRYYDPTFGNEMRASAMRLETYLITRQNEKAFEQAIILAKQLNDRNLYTTQSTAFALMAMSKFLDDKKESMLKLDWKAGNQADKIEQAKSFYSHSLAQFAKNMQVTNNGSEQLYVSVTQAGQPLPGNEQSSQRGISATLSYETLAGKTIDPSAIEQGTDFKAVVSITSTADNYKLNDMALSQIFPSGWEISNTRLLGLEDVSGQSAIQYQDIRDDRVYTYFALQRGKISVYEIRLNATYVGRYYLPAPKVEAMYYPEVIQSGTGQWINVVAPE